MGTEQTWTALQTWHSLPCTVYTRMDKNMARPLSFGTTEYAQRELSIAQPYIVGTMSLPVIRSENSNFCCNFISSHDNTEAVACASNQR